MFEKYFLSALLITPLLFGCAKEKGVYEDSKIEIYPTITRVSGLNFENGDRIGLTIRKGQDLYANNAMLTYDERVFSSSELLWYSNTSEKSILQAYYPYVASGEPTTFSVAEDQRSGTSASDMLTAVRNNITPSASAVSMTFVHLLSKLVINVSNTSDYTIGKLIVGGSIVSADVNVGLQSVVVQKSSSPQDIITHGVRDNEVYDVIIVPQTVALTIKAEMSNGDSRISTLMASELKKGTAYSIAVNITNVDMAVVITGEIKDWDDGGALNPDENTLTDQGVVYRTIKLGEAVWMADNMRSIPSGELIGERIKYPRENHTDADIKQYGLFYNYSVSRNICPMGWHIPTEEDFTALIPLLKPPYEDFIPISGACAPSGSYISSDKGFILGSTLSSVEGKRRYLCYQLGDSAPRIVDNTEASFVPVRCVKNKK